MLSFNNEKGFLIYLKYTLNITNNKKYDNDKFIYVLL